MSQHEDLDERVALPRKTREIQNHHMDSTRWNDFPVRDDDIIIATWAKSGTTWAQQIVSQLIFNGAEGINVSSLSPWVDNRVVPQAALSEETDPDAHYRPAPLLSGHGICVSWLKAKRSDERQADRAPFDLTTTVSLSYASSQLCARQEPLAGTSLMPARGVGWVGSFLAMEGRVRV